MKSNSLPRNPTKASLGFCVSLATNAGFPNEQSSERNRGKKKRLVKNAGLIYIYGSIGCQEHRKVLKKTVILKLVACIVICLNKSREMLDYFTFT